MAKYQCSTCGYKGNFLIFQRTIYDYCTATNDWDTEYVGEAPNWAAERDGDAEIGSPAACPKCRAWGVNLFEII